MEDKIKIELTQEQANLLAYLAPHKDKLKAMIKGGVFEFKHGDKVLSYNQAGQIIGIKTYKVECLK